MAKGRLVDRDEACELLAEWELSGERMSDWCAVRGLNWYSLNARKGRWAPAESALTFAEVVVPSMQAAGVGPVYRVLVGELAVEVEEDFQEDTLVRLLRAVARC